MTLTVVFMALLIGSTGLAQSQTSLTYENWAKGFFTQSCLGCHSSHLTGHMRFGAPDDVNWDTLEQIRAGADDIRRVTLGSTPKMPPNDVVWWYDRESLREWLDAGAPGVGDEFTAPPVSNAKTDIYYEPMELYLSNPINDDFASRAIMTGPLEDQPAPNVPEYTVYITKGSDNTVTMTGRRWQSGDGDERLTRLINYQPPVPLLLGGTESTGRTWESDVAARERNWKGWTGNRPLSDLTTTEHWRVDVKGVEVIDNGVILRTSALRVTQTDVTHDTKYSWWFKQGIGVIRRETDSPSSEYNREITKEFNVYNPDYPLEDPPVIQPASQEWIPFVGRYYREDSQWKDYDYSYVFEVQHVGIVPAQAQASPSATATLKPDALDTPVMPTPTSTEFPAGLPSPHPTSTPLPAYNPTAPQLSDLNKDHLVDFHDLLLVRQHWHKVAP